ncbi:MAG: PqqD family protein [Candidatus Gastranaerophilales bacterium]|nr:PqqD family protein [Candidatus Gastranaerophilales bacterium]
MKQNKSYVLKRIAGIPYLLPVGQLIADQQRGIQINETGAYLWNLLKKERTVEELTALCAGHYGADLGSRPDLERDVREFTEHLAAQGLLVPESECPAEVPFYRCIHIAGLVCALYGPPQAFPAELDAFACEPAAHPCLRIRVLSHAPAVHENGRLLLRSSDLTVIENRERYILLFPAAPQIAEIHLSKDASLCTCYCTLPFTPVFQSDLFHALQIPFLYLALQHNMAVLHSSSILYEGKAWLFSASSGTGKSTHAALWHTLYQTPVLNGDLNLLAMENGQPLIHGIPWCGSSGCSDAGTHPLGGIILLRQSASDYVEELSEDRKRLLVLQRLISPSWNGKLYGRSLRLVDALAKRILVCRLHCTPRPQAVEAVRDAIQRFLETESPEIS